MAKGKSRAQDAFDAVAGFRDLVDDSFEKLTGKGIAAWLKEFQQRPRDLPGGGEPASPQEDSGMSIETAYMVLGLPPTAPFEDVQRNYRNLAVVFHPDKGGYEEAMVLLNRAYERIQRQREGRR